MEAATQVMFHTVVSKQRLLCLLFAYISLAALITKKSNAIPQAKIPSALIYNNNQLQSHEETQRSSMFGTGNYNGYAGSGYNTDHQAKHHYAINQQQQQMNEDDDGLEDRPRIKLNFGVRVPAMRIRLPRLQMPRITIRAKIRPPEVPSTIHLPEFNFDTSGKFSPPSFGNEANNHHEDHDEEDKPHSSHYKSYQQQHSAPKTHYQYPMPDTDQNTFELSTSHLKQQQYTNKNEIPKSPSEILRQNTYNNVRQPQMTDSNYQQVSYKQQHQQQHSASIGYHPTNTVEYPTIFRPQHKYNTNHKIGHYDDNTNEGWNSKRRARSNEYKTD